MKEKFEDWKPNAETKIKLDKSIALIEEYYRQGFTMTLRGVCYQLVRRNIIPNEKEEYKKLIYILKRGRMAGG